MNRRAAAPARPPSLSPAGRKVIAWLRRFFSTAPRQSKPTAPVDAGLRAHASALQRAIGCAPTPGNKVDVLIDGPATHAAMFEAIAAARDHINIESYIVDPIGPGEELSALLLRKRAEGVQVNLIFDGWGSWRTSARYFEALRAAGVDVIEFNPINPLRHPIAWTMHLRNHRKLLVVDGRVAFIGGVNISSVYSSPPGQSARHWRDTHVCITGPIVGKLQQLFLDHWHASAERLPASANFFPELNPAGDQCIALAACQAGRRRNSLYLALCTPRWQRRSAAFTLPARTLCRRGGWYAH